jgi:predicted glycoside hydrolase/deacetylase ChbG (UPF0249 family)
MTTVEGTTLSHESLPRRYEASSTGALIINADDWGRDQETTDRIRECALRGTVSSVSAMVFMKDSQRAANIAQEKGIDAGLHLNFTTPFSGACCSAQLLEHQRQTAAYLRRHRLAQVLYHPGLARSFQYVFYSQMEQFDRLYQRTPNRLDGHHHMHLCANVLFGKLLPKGTIVRRNFCFTGQEKGLMNRLYRRVLDRFLARNHFLADFFFQLEPLEPKDRLQRIFSLSRQFVVEVEAHPAKADEYRFLTSGEVSDCLRGIPIAPRFARRPSEIIPEPRLTNSRHVLPGRSRM